MIQEIEPHKLNMEYIQKEIKDKDIVLYFEKNQVLLMKNEETLALPTYQDLKEINKKLPESAEYLFSVDEQGFFLVFDISIPDNTKFLMHDTLIFRTFEPSYLGFAGITASQLYRWKINRTYCGRCGGKMVKSLVERAQICPDCGQVEYPKISPAIIVAVTNGNRLLMVKSAKGTYQRYALVAGFVEVGETFEEAVKREVLEEVGLNIKNIRYYKNQPWAFSDSQMIGYYAELDGDDTITLQESELKEGKWFEKEEIYEYNNRISIGEEMINLFKHS